ncbi:Penicillin-binding protein 4 precursor [Serratia plymuthica]|uniref:Penicillin-binding protein 4 n=1 Tax=Serratia plymuthica TaxID=82996 RepID=A0A2X4VFV4_SERPL|nr:Penicillin-binding protein 4 precursor [Serratia plymuthica]
MWTKRRILTVYLNIVEFGDGVFGVEEASQRFFNKPAKRLTASEAALLARCCQTRIVLKPVRLPAM